MKNRSRAYVIYLFLSTYSFLNAAAEKKLSIDAFFVKEVDDSETQDNQAFGVGKMRFAFYILMKNEGDETMLISKPDKIGYYSFTNSTLTVATNVVISKTIFEEPNVPSSSSLSLVTLKKGESTQAIFGFRTDRQIDGEKIKFIYHVGDEVGKRFGTWTGQIEVPVRTWHEFLVLKSQRNADSKSTEPVKSSH